jgi:hypothetical protein
MKYFKGAITNASSPYYAPNTRRAESTVFNFWLDQHQCFGELPGKIQLEAGDIVEGAGRPRSSEYVQALRRDSRIAPGHTCRNRCTFWRHNMRAISVAAYSNCMLEATLFSCAAGVGMWVGIWSCRAGPTEQEGSWCSSAYGIDAELIRTERFRISEDIN